MALVSTVGGLQEGMARRLNEVSADHGDRYLDYINLGMEDLASQFPRASWLQTSAVLTLAASNIRWQVSSIGTDVRLINDIAISAQNRKLTFVAKDTFDALDPQPNESGIPTVYSVYNDEIYFYPVPDGTYGAQVNYSKTITTVSAASAVPEVPTRYLEGLINYGWLQGLYVREDYDLAQIVEAKYQAYVNKIKREMKQVVLESKRMFSCREIQANNKLYSDEITQTIFGS